MNKKVFAEKKSWINMKGGAVSVAPGVQRPPASQTQREHCRPEVYFVLKTKKQEGPMGKTWIAFFLPSFYGLSPWF